jgi:hypothetical protein
MRLHSFLGRLALPVALIGLTTIGASAPAQAEPTFPSFGPLVAIAFLDDQVTVINGRTKSVTVDYENIGDVDAHDVVVGFDTGASKLDPSFGFTAPGGCESGTCVIGDIPAGSKVSRTFSFKPTAPGSLSIVDRLGLTVSNDGGPTDSDELTIVRAAGGVDIEVNKIDDIKLAPGRTATVPVVIRNAGTDTVNEISVALIGEEYLSYPEKYSNCETEEGALICVFEQELAPGKVFTLSAETPLKVKVAAGAPGPASYVSAVAAVGVTDQDLDLLAARKSSGTKLALVSTSSKRSIAAAEDIDIEDIDLNFADNIATFDVKVSKNPADSVALGATFSGAVGDTRTVKVGVRNDGPAATVPATASWIYSAEVKLPAGVTATEVDEDCLPLVNGELDIDQEFGQAQGRDYLCLLEGNLAQGKSAHWSFTAKITDDSTAAGSVTVYSGAQESKASNNTAKIGVELTAGGSGGGLPVTGAPAGMVAGGGALLLAGGAVAFVLARRRRIVTVVE